MRLRTSTSIYEHLKVHNDMLISEVIDSLAVELKRTDGRTDGIVWHPSFMNGPRMTAIELRICGASWKHAGKDSIYHKDSAENTHIYIYIYTLICLMRVLKGMTPPLYVSEKVLP